MSTRLFRNTMYNVMAKLWLLGLGFVLTPYIVRKVGVAPYGIWAVISVLLGTFGLFDLGIRTSFTKFISEYRARDDTEGINEVVNTGFCYYSIFGLIILGVAFLMQGLFFLLFHTTPLFHREAVFAYRGVMIVFVLECALRPYGAAELVSEVIKAIGAPLEGAIAEGIYVGICSCSIRGD